MLLRIFGMVFTLSLESRKIHCCTIPRLYKPSEANVCRVLVATVSVSEESSRQRNLSFVIRILDVIEGHERPRETERFE